MSALTAEKKENLTLKLKKFKHNLRSREKSMTKLETILKEERVRSMRMLRREKIRKRRNRTSLTKKRMRSLRRRKKLTKKPRRWKHFAKSKKTRDVKEKPKTKKLSKPNKQKSRRRWTWTSQPNTCRENGTGSKQRVSS